MPRKMLDPMKECSKAASISAGLRPSELAALKWPRAIPKRLLKVTIYSPAQVRKLATLLWKKREDPTAESAMLFVVLGAFAGLRPTEIVGLDWSAINFAKKQISFRPTNSKRYREVSIEDNLWAFLLPYRDRKGIIVTQKNVSALVQTYFKELGVKYISDGLRRSYGTYRLMKSPVEVVQREMGIAPGMLDNYFRAGCTPAAATRYWRIYP